MTREGSDILIKSLRDGNYWDVMRKDLLYSSELLFTEEMKMVVAPMFGNHNWTFYKPAN